MNKPSTNDITGDTIQTKASTRAYRDGHDRIFAPKTPKTPAPNNNNNNPDHIMGGDTNIGTANSCVFKKPDPGGLWVRFKVNKAGTREWYCNHQLEQYYDLYCD